MRKKTKNKNLKTKGHIRKKHIKRKISEKDMAGTLGVMSQGI